MSWKRGFLVLANVANLSYAANSGKFSSSSRRRCGGPERTKSIAENSRSV